MNNKIVIILGALAVAISIGALAMSISQDKTINVTSSNAPAVQGGGATTNETLSTSKVEREVVNAINAPAKLNGRAKVRAGVWLAVRLPVPQREGYVSRPGASR